MATCTSLPLTDPAAGNTILFHAKYPETLSGSLRGIPVFRNLIDGAEEAGGEAVCTEDTRTGREGRYICAVETAINQGGARTAVISVAGFDHERGEANLEIARSRCPDLGDEYFAASGTDSSGEQFVRASADMVTDEDSLVRYLKGVEEHISQQFAAERSGGGAQAGLPLERMIQLMPCWRMPPWESGSIYFFIVTYTDRMYALFNGLTPQLQDRSLILIDENDLNVGQAILEEVLKERWSPFLDSIFVFLSVFPPTHNHL